MRINKNLRLKISLFITVIGIAALVVGASYALFNTVLSSNKSQVIKTGAIAVKITETGESLEQLTLQELIDEEGKNSDTYYSFTIKNIGTEKAGYKIFLLDEEGKTNTLDDKYVRVSLEVNETKTSALNLEEIERLIYQDTIEKDETKEYKLRIWLNFGDLTETQKVAELNKEAYFKIKVEAEQFTSTEPDVELDPSNANAPELASNMIPVIYDSGNSTWVKADSSNKDLTWFNYTDKKWANAVTVTSANRDTYLKASAGTPIAMNDINTMWVWIPRFSATSNGSYNGGTQSAPGAFNITFVDTNTTAHDAFTFGSDPISGFWIGKFENSSNETCEPASSSDVGAGCNLTSIRPKVLPNATSWRGASVSTFFSDIQKMADSGNQYGFDKTKDTTLDTHMLKNNEWGAVAYLTQSIYGRCSSSTSCTEVGINNNSSYITGYGAPAGSGSSVTNGAYNTSLGMDASTTGNIYGVYDMSGGAYEYVMGNYNNTIGNSQFTTLPNTKYYNVYTTSSAYTTAGLQHALEETKNWYGDYAIFVDSNYPWFRRGGNYSFTGSAGVFSFYGYYGRSSAHYGSRLSVTIN